MAPHDHGAHGGQDGHAHREPPSEDHHRAHLEDFRRRFWVVLALTVPVLALSPMIQEWLGLREVLRFTGDIWVLAGLSTVVFVYGGLPFLRGLVREVADRNPGMMTLVGVAISVAFLYSWAVVLGFPGEPLFWELSTLVGVFLLGHWIEMRSVLGASRALEELVRLMPSEAHKIQEDGSVDDVPIDQLALDDRILIRPGEKIPADGRVVEGRSSVNEAMLTGESAPVTKGPEDAVIGGAINGEGSLTVAVQKLGADSFLTRVIDMVRQAQASKSRTQDLANRAARVLTFVALGGGTVTVLFWLLAVPSPVEFAVERAVTVMVIACPHALGLAVPLVLAVSTSLAAGTGLLIRNRVAFEQARGIEAILFDKTGTLTLGAFGVTDVVMLDDRFERDELLALAASVEHPSEHPIARGIAASVERHRPVRDFRAITGHGVEGRVGDHRVQVVSPGFAREQGDGLEHPQIERLSEQGKTVVVVRVDDRAVGAIAAADIIRPESKAAIATLHAMGIRPMMLTGDNHRVARWVAEEVGLDAFFAEVRPEEKANKVREVQARGLKVAMTGDGVNDAPALAQADVGIAVGAGTDVAIETADVILVRSNPQDVVAVVQLARSTFRKMVQNLAWATGYNVVALPLAAGVLVPWGVVLVPAVGALLMSASTVIVAINSRFLSLG